MKICSTCFDVTVSLLRTIEMILCVAPILILNKESSKSEMLLVRLLQVELIDVFVRNLTGRFSSS
jgi:Kip1 ubiquitination-promoting complex protein 1